MDMIVKALALGIFATVAIDLWAVFANKVLKLTRTNWALVGRWLGHIPSGKFVHDPIGASPGIQNELLLGWCFHYLIGVIYALLYVVLVNALLGGAPTLLSAWGFGVATVLAPWFVMQPGLGLGICAVKAPKPSLARMQNLIIHSIFGIALYVGWTGGDRLF